MEDSLRRLQHPRFARFYTRMSTRMEVDGGVAAHRQRLLTGLTGTVIDVGIGNGLNLRHYPPEVTEVIGVEPDDSLRAAAEQAARAVPAKVRLVAGRAERLPAEDGSCDAVVVSLVLCSVPNPAAALAELRRVLKPGGELRFYEHVRARSPLLALGQTLLIPATTRFLGGCHFNRDTAAAITEAGFTIQTLDRFPANGLPHILGTAT